MFGYKFYEYRSNNSLSYGYHPQFYFYLPLFGGKGG